MHDFKKYIYIYFFERVSIHKRNSFKRNVLSKMMSPHYGLRGKKGKSSDCQVAENCDVMIKDVAVKK